VGVHLVQDRERGFEAVQQASVGGEDAHVAAERPRLGGVGAVADLEVAVDEVRVVEHAGEVRSGFVQDPGLLSGCGCAVDGGVVHGQQVVVGDRGEQVGLAVAAREQDHRLPLRPGDRLRDPTLEGL
jgi:hypothetical protein